MNKNLIIIIPALLIGLILFTPDAYATGNVSLPWDSPMKTILKSISGPIAKAISAIAIILAGLGLALGEGGGGTKKLLMIVMGIAIALGSTSVITSTLFDNTSQVDAIFANN